jgi:hypothetical protein
MGAFSNIHAAMPDTTSRIGGDTPVLRHIPSKDCPKKYVLRTSCAYVFAREGKVIAEFPRIHHHNRQHRGKQPENPRKKAIVAPFLADHNSKCAYLIPPLHWWFTTRHK